MNGYIEKVHLDNCDINNKDLVEVNEKNEKLTELALKHGFQKNSRKAMTAAKQSGIININDVTSQSRDPFMTRNLDFELEQICQSFNLLEYGV